MKQEDIKVGMKVIVAKDDSNNSKYFSKGAVGTITDEYGGSLTVSFESGEYDHGCGGEWSVRAEFLEPYTTDTFMTKSDVLALLEEKLEPCAFKDDYDGFRIDVEESVELEDEEEPEEPKYIVEYLNQQMNWETAITPYSDVISGDIVDDFFEDDWIVYSYNGMLYRVKEVQ